MNIHLYLCPKMRTRDENKEIMIREKAFEMVVKEGFDGLSMQKLARAANVSPATIYIYYKSREDLLNRIFNDAQKKFAKTALINFDANMSLEDGLWIQWKNRMQFVLEFPNYFQFFEQFRNSPLINHKDVDTSEFRENMKNFVKNAIRRGELAKMEPEVFWALAYGSLYSLIKFHLQEKKMMNENFKLSDAMIKQAFKMVVKSLKH
jgi:TetR/AcrR family transcriptional repressor of multidrug resistance operon